MSPAELAQFSSASVKLQILQHRMHQLDLSERDVDRARRQPAGIIESAIDLPQAVQPAERDLHRAWRQPAGIIDLPQAVQPAERDLDQALQQPTGIIDLPQAVQPV